MDHSQTTREGHLSRGRQSICLMHRVARFVNCPCHPRSGPITISTQYPKGWAVGLTGAGLPIATEYGASVQLFSNGQIGVYLIDPRSSLVLGTPGFSATLDFSLGPGNPSSWAGPFHQGSISFLNATAGYFSAGNPANGGWEGISLGGGVGPTPLGASYGTVNYRLLLTLP